MVVSVLEALVSRLCHDLAGPAGAIRNGMELIEDSVGANADPEAMRLIADSADRLARRLRLYRLAWGQAGSVESARLVDEVRVVAEDWLRGGKVALDWSALAVPAGLGSRLGVAHLILCAILIAEESLPRGGTVQVVGEGDGNHGVVEVLARGAPARLTPDSAAVLAAAAITDRTLAARPHAVHALALRHFADSYRFSVPEVTEAEQQVRLRLTW
ncbi:histidine phosphotransferase ChpT [uncultured Gammaproteobacteria bacterium]